jgi:hypothetical protein
MRELMKGPESHSGLQSLGKLVELIGELDSAGKLDFSRASLERGAR